MCRCLKVSRGGYYQWKIRPLSSRRQSHAAMANEIKQVFDDEKTRAGSSRIAKRLIHEDHRISRDIAAKIMKSKARPISNHSLPVAPNRLAQDFEVTALDKKWGCGIPTSGWIKADCIWPPSRSYIHAKSLVGLCPRV